MKALKAILMGAIAWALIFVVWTIILFTPGLKDLAMTWQYVIHYVALIFIVLLVTSYYYKADDKKTNGFLLGVVMLLTGIALDLIITMPLFVLPQGTSHVQFFFNPLMLFSYLEFIVISGLYWLEKIHKKK